MFGHDKKNLKAQRATARWAFLTVFYVALSLRSARRHPRRPSVSVASFRLCLPMLLSSATLCGTPVGEHQERLRKGGYKACGRALLAAAHMSPPFLPRLGVPSLIPSQGGFFLLGGSPSPRHSAQAPRHSLTPQKEK